MSGADEPDTTEEATTPREIELRIRTIGGHEHQLRLPEDAPELRQLFTTFVNRPGAPGTAQPALVQLPLDGGTSACTIAADQIVSIITSPPVLVELQQPAAAADTPAAAAPPHEPVEPPSIHRPECVVIDDFLGVDEHADMLAYAIRERERFEPGTVEGHEHPGRRNSVVMDFTDSAHANLLVNRLLLWFPLIAERLRLEQFPLKNVESQLTASNDGDFYQSHLDTDGQSPEGRAIACVYYFHGEPKGFSGGELRLYDRLEQNGTMQQAESFQTIQPANNRLIAFTATTFHELRPIRCPSMEFADGRFAITTWLHRTDKPDPNARFGWGQFHCGTVPSTLRNGSTVS